MKTPITIAREVAEDDLALAEYKAFRHVQLCDRETRPCPYDRRHAAAAKMARIALEVAQLAEDATDDAHETEYDDMAARAYAAHEADEFNRRWVEHKNEFARREREQEAAAFMSDPDFRRLPRSAAEYAATRLAR